MRQIDRRAEASSERRAVAEALTDQHAVRPQDRAQQRRADISEEDIRVRAYYYWDAAGQPAGDGVEFWLRAERELNGLGG